MRKLHLLAGAVLLVFALASPRVWAADEVASNHRPVKEVASLRISVGTQSTLPLYVSADWSNPLPDIMRAVLVLHGRLRNADVYYRSAQTAQAAAAEAGKTTIMIVPQFLAGIDVDAYQLSPDKLRWSLERWEGGDPAVGPTPASSFDALDAILARLADRRLFPNLKQVVVAGHSSGAGRATRRDRGKARVGAARHHTTNSPWRSAMPIVARAPALNARKSASMPSLKITPCSAIPETIVAALPASIRPDTSEAPVVRLGNGSRTK
jgi:hypothetical protein